LAQEPQQIVLVIIMTSAIEKVRGTNMVNLRCEVCMSRLQMVLISTVSGLS
jgi:hypothetical protein